MELFAVISDRLEAAAKPVDESLVFVLLMVAMALAIALPVWIFVAGQMAAGKSPIPYEGRRPVPWHGIDVLIVTLFAIAIQTVLPALLMRRAGIEWSADHALPEGAAPSFLIYQSSALACSFAVAVLFLNLHARATWSALGFSLRAWRSDVASGLISAMFIVPPVLVLHVGLVQLWPSKHPLIESVQKDPAALPVAAILAVFIAPLVEEFLFRVVLQGWLESVERLQRKSPEWPRTLPAGTVSVLISSVLFAAAHFGHGPDPIPLFFLALVLGYLYHQTHRIWPSLVLHMTLNGLTTILLWMNVAK